MLFNCNNPTNLMFGSGSLDQLGSPPMPGVAHAVLDKIMENPRREVIAEGAAFAKDNGCNFIVALGGGAVLDASIAIAANPCELTDEDCAAIFNRSYRQRDSSI